MAFIKIPGWPIGYPPMGTGSFASFNGLNPVDASGEKSGWIIQCPKDGVLNRVGFRLSTVAQAPVNGLTVSFQDVGASGVPDGTQDQTRLVPQGDIVSNTFVTTGLITSDGTDTGAKRTVTQGELLAIVVEFASFATGDNIIVSFSCTGPFENRTQLGGFPYAVTFTTSWAKDITTGMMNIALQYDDGTWEPITACIPAETAFSTAFNSSSSPDERGMKFIVPVAMRAVGVWCGCNIAGTTSTYKFHLYDSNDVELASATLDPDVNRTTGASTAVQLYFNGVADSVELVQGATYRVTLEATGAGNLTIHGWIPDSSAFASATPWGEDAVMTTRTNGGAWTDETNGTYLGIGLLIDAIDPVKAAARAPGMLQNLAPFMRSFLR